MSCIICGSRESIEGNVICSLCCDDMFNVEVEHMVEEWLEFEQYMEDLESFDDDGYEEMTIDIYE